MKQIQQVLTMMKRGHHVALFAVIIALASFAHADSMHSHKAKKGSLKITVPTEIGGVLLQPGDYEFKEVKAPGGPVLEIVHLFDDFTAPEGLPVHQQEVVAHVDITEQALSSAPKRTQLQLASTYTANATALQIKGDDVEYLFGTPQGIEQAEATVPCTTGQN